MTALALDKIEKIKELTRQGLSYEQITNEIGIHKSTAHRLGKDYAPSKKRITQSTCYANHRGLNLKCTRPAGHGGIHLGNDKYGRLFNW